MTTPQLVDFYYEQVKSRDVLPRSLEQFSIVVGDPGDMGSKNGITILSLEDPGQYGRVDVKGRIVRTSNVNSLDFNPSLWHDPVTIDGQAMDFSAEAVASIAAIRMRKSFGKS